MLVSVLAEPRRRAILDTFAARPAAALTVDDIAAEQHLHRSVAFTHLERLADAGLLVRGRRPGRRGRPARTYRYAGCAVEASQPPRQHRLLAQILGAALDAEGAHGAAVAHEQGRRHGLSLAAGPGSAAAGIEALAAMGGDYQLQGGIVLARNCVFREACDKAREIVCSAHAGIIEGALEAAGATLRVLPDGPDASGGCRYHLDLPRSGGLLATAGSRSR